MTALTILYEHFDIHHIKNEYRSML